MTYLNAKKYLAALPNRLPDGATSALPAILKELGQPEQGRRYVCLTGSSGKSICTEMLLSIYAHSSYRVGALSTLCREDPCRSIRLGTAELDESSFAALTDRLRKLPMTLTASEFLLCVALLAFREAGVELALLECEPSAVDLSHFLPVPLGAVICGTVPHSDPKQLRGIRQCIRHGIVYIISSAQGSEAYTVISKLCSAAGCRLFQPAQPELRRLSLRSTEFSYQGTEYHLRLCGRFQVTNATLALETVARMESLGYPVDPESIHIGLSELSLPCKFEILSVNPTIIADSTHSPIALETVCHALDDFQAHLGTTIRLCLPDGELVQPYTDTLSRLGYSLSATLLLSDRNEVESLTHTCRFARSKELIRAALRQLSPGEILLISGPHAFTQGIRRKILEELNF